MPETTTDNSSWWARTIDQVSREVVRVEKQDATITGAAGICLPLLAIAVVCCWPTSALAVLLSVIFAVLGSLAACATCLEGAFNYWLERKQHWKQQGRAGLVGMLLCLPAIYLTFASVWKLLFG